MCTYQTETLKVSGSAKTASGWTTMTDATVYFDHPVHFSAGHALLIDVLNPAQGPSARTALELSPESARALANAILHTLDAVPSGLLSNTNS
ncbi:MAG: hypothetical protein JWM55_871 [Acidimicrobiaceae bacterium]|nr:hypothetical protein [Acidimicrobiaceae bacterium]